VSTSSCRRGNLRQKLACLPRAPLAGGRTLLSSLVPTNGRRLPNAARWVPPRRRTGQPSTRSEAPHASWYFSVGYERSALRERLPGYRLSAAKEITPGTPPSSRYDSSDVSSARPGTVRSVQNRCEIAIAGGVWYPSERIRGRRRSQTPVNAFPLSVGASTSPEEKANDSAPGGLVRPCRPPGSRTHR
jgi:hypothetical protein